MRTPLPLLLPIAIPFLFALGCSTSASSSDGGAPDLPGVHVPDLAPAAAPDLAWQGLAAARPYMSKVPANYDPKKPTPLVILLHGYSASGPIQDYYFGVSKIVDAKGFLYAFPDGLVDQAKNHYWNADDACCDIYKSGVDDVAYINAVIDDMSFKFNVDPKRIFLMGHSNGAFMAHRMACDSAPRIAAIAALAGDIWKDVSKCQPQDTVAVLQIHGDADAVIAYKGGTAVAAFPSAVDSINAWAQKNNCNAMPTAGTPLDLDTLLAGDETTVAQHLGCKAGGAAELWTIRGGGHVPNLQPTWAATLYDWLAAHPKP